MRGAPTDAIERLNAALADRYRIERELGAGGMATVYLAEDLRHHRQVALKVLKPEIAATLGAGRFAREIEVAARLQHPNILPLHDSGEADGFLFYVMPYVEGESLRERLSRGELPIPDAVRILMEVADALSHAHAHGVVHRDIKPDNVMLSGRHALVTDFGVAKAVTAATAQALLTSTGVALGTPTYMAPEQATADPHQDHRVDIYALGVLGYELLTGRAPYSATTAQEMLAAHVTAEPEPLEKYRPRIPPALAAVVLKCLAKKPADRWETADEVRAQLEPLARPTGGITPIAQEWAAAVARHPARFATLLAVALLGAGALVAVSARHSARVRWVREQAAPQIRRLADSGLTERAYELAMRARAILPNDSGLATLWADITRRVNIRTDPPGARVYRREYAADDSAWQFLGITPLDSVSLPAQEDLSRFRFEKEGFRTLEVSGIPGRGVTTFPYVLNDGKTAPAGMVRVPGYPAYRPLLAGIVWLKAVPLGAFSADVHEVTNRQFKAFVDSGGYQRREFWDQPFVLRGRPLAWDAAMARFVDRTGRPGPATWEGGDYPAGKGDFPVAGVSWYEAAAYAKFAHKSLPTIYHWARAAGVGFLDRWIIPHSNFGDSGPAPVGSYRGVGPYGTYDMAGNVREWCANASGSERYILGGGWNDPGYFFGHAYTQPPFDRSATNGIRLATYLPGDTTVARLSLPVIRPHRDFAQERPVSDAVFDVYRHLYDYDPTPLHARIEASDSSAEDWVRQQITFDAAYGKERVTAYLYLPRRRPPPYQTLVYFPGANALALREFDQSEIAWFDFVLRSGRAVMHPIYKGTYERADTLSPASAWASETNYYRNHVIRWVQDLRRSVDYLETRADVSASRLGYYGFSWGGELAGQMLAVEPRFKVAVLVVAGLQPLRARPEVEPLNYLPRVRAPVLVINGRYDFFFPYETSQLEFYRLLGTPAQDKKMVVANETHAVPRTTLIAETLPWLDKYLGPVR